MTDEDKPPSLGEHRNKELEDDLIEDRLLNSLAALSAEHHQAMLAKDEASVEKLTKSIQDLRLQILEFKKSR